MNVGYSGDINDGGDHFDDGNNIISWQEGPIVIKKDQCKNYQKGGLGKLLLANTKWGLEVTRTVKQP